jgi:hypothetical protein
MQPMISPTSHHVALDIKVASSSRRNFTYAVCVLFQVWTWPRLYRHCCIDSITNVFVRSPARYPKVRISYPNPYFHARPWVDLCWQSVPHPWQQIIILASCFSDCSFFPPIFDFEAVLYTNSSTFPGCRHASCISFGLR